MGLRMTPDWWPSQGKFRVIRLGTFHPDILCWVEGDFLNCWEALEGAYSYTWDRMLWDTMSFYIIDSSGNLLFGVIESEEGLIRIFGTEGVPIPPPISV